MVNKLDNVALRIAQEQGGLREFDGECMELVDDVLHEKPDAAILWIDLFNHPRWKYHAVPVIDGIVHDAWHPAVLLPPELYVNAVFKTTLQSWELNPGHDELDEPARPRPRPDLDT